MASEGNMVKTGAGNYVPQVSLEEKKKEKQLGTQTTAPGPIGHSY